MEKRIEAHKKSNKRKKSNMCLIENLVNAGKYNTISLIEKKTGLKRTTISGRLSDLERCGKIYKKNVGGLNETVYIETPRNQVKRKALNYSKMRVNCMLKTLKDNYFECLPSELQYYFEKTNV